LGEFDTRWDNWVGDFDESFAAGLLEPDVREHAGAILIAFGEAARAISPAFPDQIEPGTLATALTEAMPRLSLPDPARPHVPEVIARFLEYLRDGGRIGDGDDWAAQIRVINPSYQQRLKPDGGVRGVTIRKAEGASPIGRNDPCPCGSGKKYKKCCLAG